MNKLCIDMSRFLERYECAPMDNQTGSWTFVIDDVTVQFFGTFAEATTLAKLYVRMHDLTSNTIVLNKHTPVGRVHVRRG